MNFREVVDFLSHEDMTETVVSPEDPPLLSTTASVTASDTGSPLSEARLGLHRGKKVTRALIHLTKDDFGFDVSVKAADFSLNSLKTPKIDKPDRDDDPDALFLEKAFLIETAVTLLDSLYRQFLGLRLDEGKWKKTTGEMMKWMGEVLA